MTRMIRKWLVALEEAEREIAEQGYLLVHGAGMAFLVPLDAEEPPPRRKRPTLMWAVASAGFA